jgi:hypothetical protein
MKLLLLVFLTLFFNDTFAKSNLGAGTKEFRRDLHLNNKDQCVSDRGVWRLFNNNCADNCSSKFDHEVCTHIANYGCECGSKRCWDKNEKKCISLKKAEKDWKEIVKKQKKQRLQDLADFREKIKTQPVFATVNAPQNIRHNLNPQQEKELIQNTNNQIAATQKKHPQTEFVAPPLITQVAETPKPSNPLPTIKSDGATKKICANQGGSWQQFNNGCADSCSSKIAKFSMCTSALKFACKCPGDKCWDGAKNSCVNIAEYKKLLNAGNQSKELPKLPDFPLPQ